MVLMVNLHLVVGELGVKEVEYSKTTKNLLLHLEPSLTRSENYYNVIYHYCGHPN